ncbi:carboxylesterase 5A-like [Lineus longissimus]|uniref:carboxylesterase 5A-like n=1 Tax=Lineus longissimus TaxID=88925 RepID=UPI00315D34DF
MEASYLFVTSLCIASVLSINHKLLNYITVNSNVGIIRGSKESARIFGRDHTVNVFRGIPYAEPPVGVLRFKRPISKTVFLDVFNATKYGDICMQPYYPELSSNFPQSEDCLSLNVYAPGGSNATNKKAVMVFIHGGGWVIGDGRGYNGIQFAGFGDVVLVTLNYRLGPFGFLSTETADFPGNMAQFDELLALQWVKSNIADFGGDPDVVTVFGESAGSFDTTLHAISPLSAGQGLFHRCIPESGSTIVPFPKHPTIVENHLERAKALAKLVGCTTGDLNNMVKCMQTTRPGDIQTNSQKMVASGFADSVWGPRVDGDFIPAPPHDLFADPHLSAYSGFKDIDLLIGSNSADGDVFLPGAFEEMVNTGLLPINLSMSKESLVKAMQKIFEGVPNENGVIKAIIQGYVPPIEISGQDGRDLMVDMLSDSVFIMPAIASAQTHEKMSREAKTFMYFFDFVDPSAPSSTYRPEKAAHAAELSFLFNYPLEDSYTQINQSWNITDNDRQLSKAMLSYWTNFAKFG